MTTDRVEINDEEQPIRDRFWHPLENETVLDIGCYIGSYTLPALQAGAHVHAFDSNEMALATLAINAGGNEHLTTVWACISDGKPYPRHLATRIPEAMRPANCPPWTIDTYTAANALHADWIKIDIEGGELPALQGAKRTLKEHRPRLIIEEHELVYPDALQGNLARVLALLWDLNYNVDVVPLLGHERRPIHLIAEPA